MRTLLVSLLMIAGCNRGPEPKPYEGEPAAAEARPTPTMPSTPAMPANHPPIGSATTGERAPAATGAPSAGGLTWDAPAPFEARPPASSMRAAEYALPAVNGDAPVLAVFYFGPGQGGSVEDNLKRWISQFTQTDGRDSNAVAKRGERQVNGMKVTTVDLTGVFAGMSPMQAPSEPKANQRLLGAIVEGPEGPVFFKLTGAAPALESAHSAFDHLIQSLRPLH